LPWTQFLQEVEQFTPYTKGSHPAHAPLYRTHVALRQFAPP